MNRKTSVHHYYFCMNDNLTIKMKPSPAPNANSSEIFIFSRWESTLNSTDRNRFLLFINIEWWTQTTWKQNKQFIFWWRKGFFSSGEWSHRWGYAKKTVKKKLKRLCKWNGLKWTSHNARTNANISQNWRQKTKQSDDGHVTNWPFDIAFVFRFY